MLFSIKSTSFVIPDKVIPHLIEICLSPPNMLKYPHKQRQTQTITRSFPCIPYPYALSPKMKNRA